MDTLLTRHPLSNYFPAMSDEEYEALKADIKEHDQQEPIVSHEGKVLDGWHRYRACCELEIEPKIKEWDGACGSPLNYVVSMNVFRRHLHESQRALLAAMVRNQSGKVSHNQAAEEEGETPELTFKEAADLVGVSDRSVKDATVVLKRGTPAEIEAVETGETTVSAVAKEIRRGKSPSERAAARRRKRSAEPRNAAVRTSTSADPDQMDMLDALLKGDETTEPFQGGQSSSLSPTIGIPEQGMDRGTPTQAPEVKVPMLLDQGLALLAELPEDPTSVARSAFSSKFRGVVESRVFKISKWLIQFCAEWQKERAAECRGRAETEVEVPAK